MGIATHFDGFRLVEGLGHFLPEARLRSVHRRILRAAGVEIMQNPIAIEDVDTDTDGRDQDMGAKETALLIDGRRIGRFGRRAFETDDADDGVLNSFIRADNQLFRRCFGAALFVVLGNLNLLCRRRIADEHHAPRYRST